MKTVQMIAACDARGALGYEGQLLWHLPEDLKRFAEITADTVLVMGRKTFESLPKPLEGRPHVICSRRAALDPANCPQIQQWVEGHKFAVDVAGSIEDAMQTAWKLVEDNDLRGVSIIGGAEIYRAAVDHVHEVYLTVVLDEAPKADCWFPTVAFRSRISRYFDLASTELMEVAPNLFARFEHWRLAPSQFDPPYMVETLGTRGWALMHNEPPIRIRLANVTTYSPSRTGPVLEINFVDHHSTVLLRYPNEKLRDRALVELDRAMREFHARDR